MDNGYVFKSIYSTKNPTVQIHIADIHFGAIDPKTQWEILNEQFLKELRDIHFDILSIDGDLFDRKFLASSDAVYYANMFVTACAEYCMYNNATLIMLSGTQSHEAGQLRMFIPMLQSMLELESYIIENTCFVYTKGTTILCIPEEYGKGAEYYRPFLEQHYDCCFMHGALVGGLYGANKEDLNLRAPVFGPEAFVMCKGPIISGHVHEHMCLQDHMYYVSNPIRYKFGEEKEKGFGIVILIPYTGRYHYQFIPIQSFKYDTYEINCSGMSSPEEIIRCIQNQNENCDFLKAKISGISDFDKQSVLAFMRSNEPGIKLEFEKSSKSDSPNINTTEEILDKYSGMEFLLDPNIDPYTKLSMYIKCNEKGLDKTITPEELKNIKDI